jgi:hypothetical protein
MIVVESIPSIMLRQKKQQETKYKTQKDKTITFKELLKKAMEK